MGEDPAAQDRGRRRHGRRAWDSRASLVALVTRAGVSPESVEEVTGRLMASGTVRRIGDLIVDATALAAVSDGLLAMVTAFHASHP